MKAKKEKKVLIVENIRSEKVQVASPFKVEVLTKIPLPADYVRVIVLKDHNGMMDELRAGDIVDVPHRRFKSLANRGLVKEYVGKEQPNKRR